MGLSIRHYIIQDDGSFRRVPRRVAEALPLGTDAIPEYAGTKQKVAEVLIDNEDGKPDRIPDVVGAFWDFDDVGKIDVALHKASAEWINFAFSNRPKKPQGIIVDLVPELKRKDLNERHRWTVTKDLLDLIAADIWPGISGPAPEVTTVKGKAPKRPPLTQEARWALDEIEKNVSAIKHRLDTMSERGLKGLAFEASRSSFWDNEILWKAIAEQAKRCEAVRATHRTGKGEWYAVLERAREDNERPHLWEQVSVACAKGGSRREALEAGRRLMAEKIDWLGEGIEICITLRSALEWQPEED